MITISGKAGSGKSTIAKLLVEKLGYEYISIGAIRRKLADEMGISIYEFNRIGDIPGNEEKFDKQYEEYQRSLDPKANIVLDSRLGFFCQPNAFKVFLDVDISVAANRIMSASRGDQEEYKTKEEAMNWIKARNDEDKNRYMKLYGIDYFAGDNYDLLIDTSDKSIDDILELILENYGKWQDSLRS